VHNTVFASAYTSPLNVSDSPNICMYIFYSTRYSRSNIRSSSTARGSLRPTSLRVHLDLYYLHPVFHSRVIPRACTGVGPCLHINVFYKGLTLSSSSTARASLRSTSPKVHLDLYPYIDLKVYYQSARPHLVPCFNHAYIFNVFHMLLKI